MNIKWKKSNQLTYIPRMMPMRKELVVTNNTYIASNVEIHPIKQYRKQGVTCNLGQPYTVPPNCLPCANSRQVGVPLKMIGKDDEGKLMYDCCIPGPIGDETYHHVNGNIIDFSGRATIRTARGTGYTRKPYYTNNYAYLYSRGNTFIAKSKFSLPQIPNEPFAYKETTETENPACSFTVFNPSNPQFKVTGPVSSSTRTDRLIYNTITKNNKSLVDSYQVNHVYTKDPLFTIKSKTNICRSNYLQAVKYYKTCTSTLNMLI